MNKQSLLLTQAMPCFFFLFFLLKSKQEILNDLSIELAFTHYIFIEYCRNVHVAMLPKAPFTM